MVTTIGPAKPAPIDPEAQYTRCRSRPVERTAAIQNAIAIATKYAIGDQSMRVTTSFGTGAVLVASVPIFSASALNAVTITYQGLIRRSQSRGPQAEANGLEHAKSKPSERLKIGG